MNFFYNFSICILVVLIISLIIPNYEVIERIIIYTGKPLIF